MALDFCFSAIIGPVVIVLSLMTSGASAQTWVGLQGSHPTFGSTVLWYVLFVLCMTIGSLVAGWLFDLALYWCKGINLEVTEEEH